MKEHALEIKNLKLETAKKLKISNVDIKIIAESTGLSISEIEEL